MAVTIVIGAQWGDEGKGKVTDMLAPQSDFGIRYNGGGNAGHTVINEFSEFTLHTIPAVVLNPDAVCIIGRGVLIHPAALVQEMKELAARGIAFEGRLKLSPAANLVMPWHFVEEKRAEEQYKIGTTGRGIGPCQKDRIGRWHGMMVNDLKDLKLFLKKLEQVYQIKAQELVPYKLPPFEEVRYEYLVARDFILPYVEDTSRLVQKALREGKSILLEGAQGTLLDVDHGTYPYVTSSNTTAMAACMLANISPSFVSKVILVTKAYLTRVGGGPFPTELSGELDDQLRNLGKEFGATTGRPRRCGWLDLPLLRYACELNDIGRPMELVVTKMDILGQIPLIKLCQRYKGVKGGAGEAELLNLGAMTPTYTLADHAGWGNLAGCQYREDLPPEAKKYLSDIRLHTGVPIGPVSIGSKRKETIFI